MFGVRPDTTFHRNVLRHFGVQTSGLSERQKRPAHFQFIICKDDIRSRAGEGFWRTSDDVRCVINILHSETARLAGVKKLWNFRALSLTAILQREVTPLPQTRVWSSNWIFLCKHYDEGAAPSSYNRASNLHFEIASSVPQLLLSVFPCCEHDSPTVDVSVLCRNCVWTFR